MPLGTEFRSFATAARALDHWVFSPAPCFVSIFLTGGGTFGFGFLRPGSYRPGYPGTCYVGLAGLQFMKIDPSLP